jgi:hypothetical protein
MRSVDFLRRNIIPAVLVALGMIGAFLDNLSRIEQIRTFGWLSRWSEALSVGLLVLAVAWFFYQIDKRVAATERAEDADRLVDRKLDKIDTRLSLLEADYHPPHIREREDARRAKLDSVVIALARREYLREEKPKFEQRLQEANQKWGEVQAALLDETVSQNSTQVMDNEKYWQRMLRDIEVKANSLFGVADSLTVVPDVMANDPALREEEIEDLRRRKHYRALYHQSILLDGVSRKIIGLLQGEIDAADSAVRAFGEPP